MVPYLRFDRSPVRGGRDRRPLVALAGLVLLLSAWHVWWIWTIRRGSLLLIDEAGFMATSIENAKWLSGQGLAGLWQSYRTQEVHGPLGPLAATPLQLLAGPSEMAAWVTVVGFGAAGTLAVFALARTVV